MALIKRITLILLFLLKFQVKAKQNLIVYLSINLIQLIIPITKLPITIFCINLFFSFYFLFKLFNDDKILYKNNFYNILNINLIHVHIAKIIFLFCLILIPFGILYFNINYFNINFNFLHTMFFLSLSFIFTLNFYKIKQQWLMLIILALYNFLLSFIFIITGYIVLFLIGITILIFTIYTYNNEYSYFS